MPNLQGGAGGALSGGAAGAAIGSAVPGIGTAIGAGAGALIGGLAGLFSGGGDDAEEIAKQRAALYEQLMQQYYTDPRATAALEQLKGIVDAHGLDSQARADLMQAEGTSADFARGREGAIEQRMRASGAGQSVNGLAPMLEEQAAQAATSRLSGASVQAAAAAEQRRSAALSAFLQGVQRNQDMLNSYRLAAAGGESSALQGLQDLKERQAYANTGNVSQGLNAAGAVALGLSKRGAPAAGDKFAPNSGQLTPDMLGGSSSFLSGSASAPLTAGDASYTPAPTYSPAAMMTPYAPGSAMRQVLYPNFNGGGSVYR